LLVRLDRDGQRGSIETGVAGQHRDQAVNQAAGA
jgi:hypothetical protein